MSGTITLPHPVGKVSGDAKIVSHRDGSMDAEFSLPKPMVRHFGMFQFKEGIDPTQIGHCFAEMQAMVGKIPGLLAMEHGAYESTEGLNDGFTHGFIMSFDTAASRDAYLPHPEHERVRDIVVPCLERVVVFDFEI